MEILNIENLSFCYPASSSKALNEISLSVNEGDFIVLCGKTGCGKTTLLRMIKRELSPYGERSGKVSFKGKDILNMPREKSASEIGFVLQKPEQQIVTDKVWHELAFGLESLGMKSEAIRLRCGEMANYFGIHGWINSSTDKLSGGQKQLLNLASVMAMSPSLLLLDEPTSQLDPIAAADFISTLKKLNRELGLTIIMSEHRLEEVFPAADKVIVMSDGEILMYDKPEAVAEKLIGNDLAVGLPSAARIYHGLDINTTCPLTVNQGRRFLNENFFDEPDEAETVTYEHSDKAVVTLSDVWFRYEKNSEDVVKGLSLEIYSGEFYCILGSNGVGKSTVLNICAGLSRQYSGNVRIMGKKLSLYKNNQLYDNCVAMLPQNPDTVFSLETVRDELNDVCKSMNCDNEEAQKQINDICVVTGITQLLDRHPYDLSGGEQQKAAIAKILLRKPTILLLDEPTKCLDAASKRSLSLLLKELKEDGVTIIAVSHDVEFAAENADRCGLMFDGTVISQSVPQEFFSRNNFYTTAASRISRTVMKNAVTCGQVVERCLKLKRRTR